MRVLLALPVAVALAAAGSAAGSRSLGAARACTLASPAQVRMILGLAHSAFIRNYDNTAPAAGAVNTQCGIGLWDGAAPVSKADALAAAASGRAAQVGIETWAPQDRSAGLQQWLDRDYDKLTREFRVGVLTFPGLLSARGLPAHRVTLPHLAGADVGVVVAVPGTGRRVSASLGCWWRDQAHAALCMFVESGGRVSVTGRLAALARIVAPRFFASP